MERVINGAISGINWMIGQLNRIQIEIPDWVPGIGGGTLGFNIGTIGAVSLPRLESGGVMQSAGLFWANENGKPEMVGRMGGHAAVANNDQIVEGITYGVREANDDVVTAIYAVAQQIIGAMREQDGGSGEFDLGRYIARQQRETARMNG